MTCEPLKELNLVNYSARKATTNVASTACDEHVLPARLDERCLMKDASTYFERGHIHGQEPANFVED